MATTQHPLHRVTRRGLPARYPALLALWIQEGGADVGALLEGNTISTSELLNSDHYLAVDDVARLVAKAYALSGVAAMGLQFGASLNISSHTALGHAIMNCQTFGQAMELFLKYYRIVVPGINMNMGQFRDEVHISLNLNEDMDPQMSLPVHFTLESFFAAIYTSSRFLLQREALPFQLELSYPEPGYVSEYHRILGTEVRFNCPHNRLSFPSELNRHQLSTANKALLAMYEQQCDQLLQSIERDETLGNKIYRLLSQFDGSYPNLVQVAGLLAMSPRTLRRRLSSEGSSYQQILDEVRRDLAIEYLTHTELPLASIAYMLGYNDLSNFRRAFIKWTGRAPLSFRDDSSVLR